MKKLFIITLLLCTGMQASQTQMLEGAGANDPHMQEALGDLKKYILENDIKLENQRDDIGLAQLYYDKKNTNKTELTFHTFSSYYESTPLVCEDNQLHFICNTDGTIRNDSNGTINFNKRMKSEGNTFSIAPIRVWVAYRHNKKMIEFTKHTLPRYTLNNNRITVSQDEIQSGDIQAHISLTNFQQFLTNEVSQAAAVTPQPTAITTPTTPQPVSIAPQSSFYKKAAIGASIAATTGVAAYLIYKYVTKK